MVELDPRRFSTDASVKTRRDAGSQLSYIADKHSPSQAVVDHLLLQISGKDPCVEF